MEALLALFAFVVVLLLILAALSVRIVQEYERGVIFRLGRVVAGAKGPGLFFIIPLVDRMVKVNLQTVTHNVPAREVLTRDNVTVRVDAVTYFKVTDPVRAVVSIQNYYFGTSQVAQTTLRSVCGTADLDELLAERERLNGEIQTIVDDLTEPWGVKVELVEIRDVSLPVDIQRGMARQAEAERERRAKIINAEGEFQAAQKLSDAAAVIAEHPIRLPAAHAPDDDEVAAEKNSTLVLPIPIELLGPFRSAFGDTAAAERAGTATSARRWERIEPNRGAGHPTPPIGSKPRCILIQVRSPRRFLPRLTVVCAPL